MSLHSGQRFGSYEILKLLGSGGMGEVYLARDTRLDRQVAIKILSTNLTGNPDLQSRFRKEAGLAASLNHPNICTIYEAGEVDEQAYISMEYVEGKTVRDRIARGPISLNETLDVAIQVADALEEARKKNIVHRDIKSANIVLTLRNLVKVLDFGLAKQIRDSSIRDWSTAPTESSVTKTGDVRGTVAYMSPEQALGKSVDHRSDIFSFGVVLYEMLTGRLPFTGSSTTEVVDAILHAAPSAVTRYNDEAPPGLVRILNKMLEKDPDSRYQSVHEVWVDLKTLRGEGTAGGAVRKQQAPRPLFLRPTIILVVVAVLAGLAAGLFYSSKRRAGPSTGAAPPQQETVSIAVLPFRYEGDDPTRRYLGALVTDGLIASLQPVHAVAIAPYANVREIKDTDSIQNVVRDLGVRWIVRGSVAVAGDKTEITPELVASNGATIWTQTFSGPSVATLDLAKRSILNALHLAGSGSREIQQVRTPSMEAYRIYLEARNRQEGWDVEGNLNEALTLYRQALQQDPDFAAARAGLARALINLFQQNHDPQVLSQANEEANKAIGLDPNLPEALLAHGIVQLESGRSVEARDAFTRALELAPGDDSACRSLASLYSTLGRNRDAEEFYNRAIALRPNYWLNYYEMGSFELQLAGNLEAARIHLEKANSLNPEGYAPLVMLGNFHLLQGNLQEAENHFRKALQKSQNPYAYSNLGLVHYYRGQYELALRNWEAVLKEIPGKATYEANVADALRQLKRREEAETHYREAIRKFRSDLKANSTDDTVRAYLTQALAATGQCKEATDQTRGVLLRHPDSPELYAYAAITVSRCGDLDWAKQIVLSSIAANNLLVIRFDPDLEAIRQLPEVKQALERTQRSVATAGNAASGEHQ